MTKCVVLVSAAVAAAAAAQPRYTVELFPGIPGGFGGNVSAINDLGWGIGPFGSPAAGKYGYHTFLWKPGQPPVDLGAPPGLPVVMPKDITNDGLIVGWAGEDFIAQETEAYTWTWRDGVFEVYPQLVAGRYARPGFTSNAGRIIGYANDGSFIGQEAVEYGPGTITPLLPNIPGHNTALDVNNNNVLLGTEIAGAYLWFPGQADRFIFPPPSVAEPAGTVTSMNDRQDVVGSTRPAGHAEHRTATVWLDGEGSWRLLQRNARRCFAVAINNRREVVGNSQDNAGAIGDHGWYWTPETGQVIPLEELIDPPGVWGVSFASDINERGQIAVGLMHRVTGVGYGAILTPVDQVCGADCNADGVLNLADFGCFQTRFALGEPYADCNGDGILNLADFGCFTTRFSIGCP